MPHAQFPTLLLVNREEFGLIPGDVDVNALGSFLLEILDVAALSGLGFCNIIERPEKVRTLGHFRVDFHPPRLLLPG